MKMWLKVLWIGGTVFSIVSLILFLLGSTANFQRSLDIIDTYLLITTWIPTLILIIFSIKWLRKGWIPSSIGTYAGFFFGMIVLLFFSVTLIQNINTQGWLHEKITSDTLKYTADKKYEYRVDLVNVFQKNSHARLYLKNVGTGEEKNIPIGIQTNKIVGLGIKEVNNWGVLEATSIPSRYIFKITKELRIPKERFEIDTIEGTSKRLE